MQVSTHVLFSSLLLLLSVLILPHRSSSLSLSLLFPFFLSRSRFVFLSSFNIILHIIIQPQEGKMKKKKKSNTAAFCRVTKVDLSPSQFQGKIYKWCFSLSKSIYFLKLINASYLIYLFILRSGLIYNRSVANLVKI